MKHAISAADQALLQPIFGKNFAPEAKAAPGLRRFLCINNPDGTLRWVFPDTCRPATLLALYNSAGWRGKSVAAAIRTAFAFGKPNWAFSNHFWAKTPENAGDDWAVFTGTVGVNRKLVVSHGTRFFEKIPLTPDAEILVSRERAVLKNLEMLDAAKVSVPKISPGLFGGLCQSGVQPEKTLAAVALTPRHFAALDEIAARSAARKPLAETHFFEKIGQNLRSFDACPPNDFTKKVAPLRRRLGELLHRLDARLPLPVGLAHGDFTPWNSFLPADPTAPLAVYDWELALDDAPAGFDALHFSVQSGVLLRRLTPEKLAAEVREVAARFPKTSDLTAWYLLFTASYYLPRYARQARLHEQVWWLVETWERLSSGLR